jgi:hypothetical protein
MEGSAIEKQLKYVIKAERQTGGVSGYTKEETDAKLKDINYILIGVVIVLLIMMVTLIVMVATLLIDSFHINSTTYKEYSEKIDNLNYLRDENSNNQKIIVDQQSEIINLLKSNLLAPEE